MLCFRERGGKKEEQREDKRKAKRKKGCEEREKRIIIIRKFITSTKKIEDKGRTRLERHSLRVLTGFMPLCTAHNMKH